VDLLNWISQFSSYQQDSVLDPLGLEIICLSGAISGSKNNIGFGSGFDLHPIFLDPTPFMQIISDESRKCRSPIFKVFNHTYATVLVRTSTVDCGSVDNAVPEQHFFKKLRNLKGQ
jgi:hypothetical protein